MAILRKVLLEGQAVSAVCEHDVSPALFYTYYLCSVLDGCSRASLHWEIRESMTEPEVERVVQRTKEKYTGTTPG